MTIDPLHTRRILITVAGSEDLSAAIVTTFDHDDAGYLAWVGGHQSGYVINILRSLGGGTARLHHSWCRTVNGEPARGGVWTGPYLKVCSNELDALDQWASSTTGTVIRRCGTCHPPHGPAVRQHPESSFTTPPSHPAVDPAGSADVRGPLPGRPVVEAWTEDYIRFEHRPAEQERLRSAIRARLSQLTATQDQVLHATFAGAKHPAADVENLALYYIDDTGGSFQAAARFGLRFELASASPPLPNDIYYAYGYRYELVRRDAGFQHWRDGRELASWGWVDLGAFAGEKKLEQIWLALARRPLPGPIEPKAPARPFAVRVTVRPPYGVTPRLGYLVKGIVDGVVCAFQAHTDRTDLTELAERVARNVTASPGEIEALLLNQAKAVLGVVPRLLHKRGKGVQWAPSDDRCVAGELLAAEPAGTTWALRGSIVELVPA